MNLLDSEGQVIDAECSIDILEGASCVVVESSGGGNPAKGVSRRNPDYNKLLSVLLRRLSDSEIKITKIVLDSAKVMDLAIDDRTAKLKTSYPVDLSKIDIEKFRIELQREISLMHRSPTAKKGGNAQKKIRVCLDRKVNFDRIVFPGQYDGEKQAPIVVSVLNKTEREYLSAARIGQGQFRKNLKNIYCCRCPVTGIQDERLLVASHIKPWKICTNVERLDPDNGILFSALADRLFDQGLISFADDGGLLISPQLAFSDRISCGLSSWSPVEFSAGSLKYLEYHRGVEFKNDC